MAIDPKQTKNSLFGGLRKDPEQEIEDKEVYSREENVSKPDPETPKWQSFDKVTALLTTEQKEGLDRIAKKIMKFRSKDLKGIDLKERITANTLIRALAENFLDLEDSMQMQVLTSEEDVHAWVKNLLSQNFKS